MSEPTTTSSTSRADGLEISVIQDAADFTGAYEACARAFGEQIHDALWIALSPGWDTPEGRAAGAARMAERWRTTTTDREGRPNTIFLKATLPSDPDQPGSRRVVGTAVWAQLSTVEGYGNPPSAELGTPEDVRGTYAGDERAARLASQAWASLVARRIDAVRAKAETGGGGGGAESRPPALFVLDLCAVDPGFQRRGIALALVRWGLEEAARRGGLEAATEASVMGRHVYQKLGFNPVAEIEYHVDEELLDGKVFPSNLFMRTGK